MNQDSWRRIHDFCWICGSRRDLHLHHMLRGIYRKEADSHPGTWMRVCFSCHEGVIHGTPDLPYVHQLAIKMLHDPQEYDRIACNEMYSLGQPQPERVTEREVALALSMLLRHRKIYIP